MRVDRYAQVTSDILELAKQIEDRKRPSYTMGDEDVLKNFKRDASLAGITTEQNWYTHMLKQIAALGRWARDPSAEQSEPIEQRFADVINYAKLGYALHMDKEDDAP